MAQWPKEVEETLKNLPDHPGVYLMRDAQDTICLLYTSWPKITAEVLLALGCGAACGRIMRGERVRRSGVGRHYLCGADGRDTDLSLIHI